MKYLYGPLNSRRLGLSLGLSLTPHKVCSFDCVYCQLGPTTHKTAQRKDYIPAGEILDELRLWLEHNRDQEGMLNCIAFSGSGEPTLHSGIAELASGVKKLTAVPLVVITNASLLTSPQVRGSLSLADIIVPSLDAASPEAFLKIDRPLDTLNIEEIIRGLADLRKEFKGKIWLEVMLVKGLNDDLRQIRKLKQAVDTINPDKVQLNSPVRSTAEKNILAVGRKKLEKIKEILGEKAEII